MKRLVALIAAAAAVAGTVTGCGHPLIPASALRGTPAKASPVALIGIAAAAKPVVGVDLYALSNYPAADVTAYAERTLTYIKDVLNADAVGIEWNFYAPSRSSNSVQTTSQTLSASNVALVTKIAQGLGLKVQYRPLIMVNIANERWQGMIYPANSTKWFSNYYKAELPYLKQAQRLHVQQFVTATEMHLMNGSPLWSPFLRKVAKVYHGVVSYAAWDGDYLAASPHILPVRNVGMTMYRRLKLPSSATSAQVTAAWEAIWAAVSPALRARTTIDETGIQARAGAYHDPSNLRAAGNVNERVQANWFTAACKTVHRYHLGGVFFWKVDLTDNPAEPATSLSTFEGRKGAVAISKCAKILS